MMIQRYLQCLVAWFLRRLCGGAFHNGPYGDRGRYVALLTEDQYHRAMKAPEPPKRAGGTRALSADERFRWGRCPVCSAPDGEPCRADVGLQLGVRADGRRMRDGEGAHLARLERAPLFVTEKPASASEIAAATAS